MRRFAELEVKSLWYLTNLERCVIAYKVQLENRDNCLIAQRRRQIDAPSHRNRSPVSAWHIYVLSLADVDAVSVSGKYKLDKYFPAKGNFDIKRWLIPSSLIDRRSNWIEYYNEQCKICWSVVGFKLKPHWKGSAAWSGVITRRGANDAWALISRCMRPNKPWNEQCEQKWTNLQ